MCYKALLLLEHLIKHGPGKIIGDVQSSAGVLDRLQHFQYKDANLRDHGGPRCRPAGVAPAWGRGRPWKAAAAAGAVSARVALRTEESHASWAPSVA